MKKALLIIDVQNGMFSLEPPIHRGETLLKNVKKVIGYAKKQDIPVIYIQHDGPKNSPLEKESESWNIHEAISPECGDIIVHKNTPDSFYQTNLHQQLTNLHIEHLILSGIQTEACVDTTCRRGFSLGYKVTLLTDAHSTFNKSNISADQIISHHNEVLRWFADTITTGEWIKDNL